MPELFLPALDDGTDVLTAALNYGKAGFYVGPVRAGSKHPGSLLGNGWPRHTSRDPEQIVAWFAGTDHGLFIHCGRSDVIAFDIDEPDLMPPVLARACVDTEPPHQSTRTDQPGRGHFVFRVPPGRQLGNGTGGLGDGWGEVRGCNGVIIVEPSTHEKAAEGGRYRWLRTGVVPVLPDAIAELLSDANPADDAATDAEVTAFLDRHTRATRPTLLKAVTDTYARWLGNGKSRHAAAVDATVWGLKEAAIGLYPARDVVGQVRALFLDSVNTARAGSGRPAGDPLAAGEYAGIVAWAVAQAAATDPDKTRAEVNVRTPETHGQKGQNPDGSRAGGDSGHFGHASAGAHAQNGSTGAGDSGHFGHDFGDPWDDEPIPLGWRPEPLPTDALGDVLGPLVDAVAVAYQVPADLAVNLALPVITTAARGRRLLRITSDWTEVLALASLSGLASGERKSPVLRVLAAPLREHESAAQRDAKPRVAEQKARRKLAEDRAENLRKLAVKSDSTDDSRRYVDACKQLAETTVEPLPRWLADDATPEAIDRLLGEHQAIGVISAEPGLFGILAGRYNGGAPNVENVLKATSGDSITVDRAGREDTIHVESPALSLAMCIQPGRLTELNKTAVFRAAGLLARLLFALPEPRVGTRSISPKPVPQHLIYQWSTHLDKLAAADSTAELMLDHEALDRLNEFREELEPQLHPHHGQLAGISDWGSKLPGTIARIAAALTLLADPYGDAVTETTMADAIRLGRAYTSHALTAFSVIHAADDRLGHAREVLGWLRKHREPEVTLREVYRALRGRSWVESADDLRAALAALVERGHVRHLAEDREPGQPGRPSERYQLHPSHLAQPETTAEQPPDEPEEPPSHCSTCGDRRLLNNGRDTCERCHIASVRAAAS